MSALRGYLAPEKTTEATALPSLQQPLLGQGAPEAREKEEGMSRSRSVSLATPAVEDLYRRLYAMWEEGSVVDEKRRRMSKSNAMHFLEAESVTTPEHAWELFLNDCDEELNNMLVMLESHFHIADHDARHILGGKPPVCDFQEDDHPLPEAVSMRRRFEVIMGGKG